MPFLSRFLPLGPRACTLALAAGAALLSAVSPSTAWAARDTSPKPCYPDAYLGQTLEDPRAGWVMDIVWQRRVRAVDSQEGGQPCQRYVLRAAPRLGPFDTVRTTHLGDVAGFLAYRGTQGRVLTELGQDVLGEPYGGDWTFLGRQADAKGQPVALFAYRLPDTEARRYVQLRRGKLVARSPNAYRVMVSNGQHEEYAPSPESLLRRVALADGRWGLLDLRSLREVVPPRYQKAGVLTADGKPWLLFGQNGPRADTPGAQVHFYKPDGSPLSLPDVGDFALARTAAGGVAYLALASADGSACRYLNAGLQPLLNIPVPKAPDAGCPVLTPQEPLRFTSADGLVHRYQYSPDKGLQALGSPLVGTLRAAFAQRLVLQLPLTKLPADAAAPAALVASAPASGASAAVVEPLARYKVYSDAGQPLFGGQSFDGFEDLGCGNWRFLQNGVWLQFSPDGQFDNTQATQPSRC